MTIEGIIANTGKRSRIEIGENGLISGVREPVGKADIMLEDELIFPGFIDIHVHARECAGHSQDYKEDFRTAGEAAMHGGVTAIAEMPNNPVPPIDDKSYEEKMELAKKCPVDVVLYAGIGPGTKPLSKKVPYKAFMGPSVGELFFRSKEELEETISAYEGRHVSFHCEDPKVLENHKDEEKHEDRRPKEAETSAVDFALHLIEKYSLKGKICHASTMEAVGKIKDAKTRGVEVKAEVTPTHLYFNRSMSNGFLQMNPPLRTKEDNQALIEALRDGTIDFLASDHAPHTIEEKEKGISGIPELDTYGLVAIWLMRERGFSTADIARVASENPGRFLNDFSDVKYGKIEEGYAGSLTVLDIKNPFTLTRESLKTKCGWSPFEGVTFPGNVKMTIVRGKIYEN